MNNSINTLECLYSDYVDMFEHKKDMFKSYLSDYSLKCYHLVNANNNTIKRYSLCHGSYNETKEMTRIQMIKALKSAIDNNQPLIKIGV